jgi:hypothetical protein
MKIDDIDLYEVNEAFAPVPLAWLKHIGADPAKLNVNGGAIALGHPLGASGTKLMATLHALITRRRLETMCDGGKRTASNGCNRRCAKAAASQRHDRRAAEPTATREKSMKLDNHHSCRRHRRRLGPRRRDRARARREGREGRDLRSSGRKGRAIAAEIGGIFCECQRHLDESVDAGFAKARAAHGQERILVNCAGTGNAIKTASRSKEDGSIKHFPLDAFNWIIQINLSAPSAASPSRRPAC